MRWLRYIMVVIALAGAVGAYLYHRAAAEREFQMVDSTRNAVIDLGQRMRYLKATERIALNEFGWPDVIDPKWFDGFPPRNSMVNARHPWLEVATDLEYALDHPVQRVAINEQLAGFWYNPAKGIVRARVQQTVSDEKTIDLYNRVNGVSVSELFDSSPKRRILEELRRDEEEQQRLEELETVQRQGVTIRRGDGTEDDSAAGDGGGVPDDEIERTPEDDAAGPVPVDEPVDEPAPSETDESREGADAGGAPEGASAGD